MMSPEELRPEMKRRLQDVTDVLMFQTQQLSSGKHNWSKESIGSVHMANAGYYLKSVVCMRCDTCHPKPTKT
jgi:hypothetical protein